MCLLYYFVTIPRESGTAPVSVINLPYVPEQRHTIFSIIFKDSIHRFDQDIYKNKENFKNFSYWLKTGKLKSLQKWAIVLY